MSEKARVVFDCNTLQALGSPNGPAGLCIQLAVEGQIILIVSPVILAELKEVLERPSVIRQFKLRAKRADEYLETLQRIGWSLQGFPEPFIYARDPDDAHFINLALAANAKLIVSRDKDLLDLMDSSKPDGQKFHKQFPGLRILDPVSFLKEFAPQA